jgi:hypothetical protein
MTEVIFSLVWGQFKHAQKRRQNSNNQFFKLLLGGGEVALDIGSIAAAGEINPALKWR